MDEFFKDCLKKALKNGELPGHTKIGDVLVSLLTIMVGTLIAGKVADVSDLKYHYQRHLQMLWRELGAKKTLRITK